MRVMKFGGTSVKDAPAMQRVLEIVSPEVASGVVLVASAMGDTTDVLQDAAHAAGRGDRAAADGLLDQVRRHHVQTARALLSAGALPGCEAQLDQLFDELGSILAGVSLLRYWSPRSNDAILGFGERFSTVIIAARAAERGLPTTLLDSRELIRTDATFMGANVNEAETRTRIRGRITRGSHLWVAQGFIAATEEGVQTTLGRGGSDYSAAIFGAALEAIDIQIWTDVDGIMTCDPRMVAKARVLPTISYREAAELAFFGARVLHPATIQPAVNSSIPVIVRNTMAPQRPGTRIGPAEDAAPSGPIALAFKTGVTVVNLSSSRMVAAYGFLRRIFETFERHQTAVDMVATSEVSVAMTVDDSRNIDAIVRELSAIGSVEVTRQRGIISLVGRRLWHDPAAIARMCTALAPTRVEVLSLGASDTNIAFVVAEAEVKPAVLRLHQHFFEEP